MTLIHLLLFTTSMLWAQQTFATKPWALFFPPNSTEGREKKAHGHQQHFLLTVLPVSRTVVVKTTRLSKELRKKTIKAGALCFHNALYKSYGVFKLASLFYCFPGQKVITNIIITLYSLWWVNFGAAGFPLCLLFELPNSRIDLESNVTGWKLFHYAYKTQVETENRQECQTF